MQRGMSLNRCLWSCVPFVSRVDKREPCHPIRGIPLRWGRWAGDIKEVMIRSQIREGHEIWRGFRRVLTFLTEPIDPANLMG